MTAAQTGDARLLRRVRWQLVAWSGGIVLVVLVVLGSGPVLRGRPLARRDRRRPARPAGRTSSPGSSPATPAGPGPGRPPVGIAFGGPSSGTFAFVSTPSGEVFGPSGFDLPAGLPADDGVEAARDIRRDRHSDRRRPGNAGPGAERPIARAGTVYVLQVGQDITAERHTIKTLITVPAVGGLVAIIAALAAGGRHRPPGARPDPRCAPPPARVRRGREPRAADAAGRRPGKRRAPPAQPRQAGSRGRNGGRRHHRRDRSPDGAGRGPAPARPE